MDNCLERYRIPLPDAEIWYYPNFWDKETATHYLETFTQTIIWKQDKIKLFGKELLAPRLTAWYSLNAKPYTYSGMTKHPHPYTAELLEIQQTIETTLGYAFNSVLLNLYRNEQESMAWHADDEPELGKCPTIASMSLGTTRNFRLKHKKDRQRTQSIPLTHGSLLIMTGATQHNYLHCIPKSRKPLGTRMNLTFRFIH